MYKINFINEGNINKSSVVCCGKHTYKYKKIFKKKLVNKSYYHKEGNSRISVRLCMK